MADSNRVFVSPGVYTSEKDLTFVAQSVGVTTLGLVGETLKGPAFEPLLITDFDAFRTFFGSTSPLKDSNQNPKYELPYVAKAYLQESNQLFVTRILGLTGYLPVKTYGLKALGGIILGDTTAPVVETGLTMSPSTDPSTGITTSTLYGELSGKTSTDTNGDTVTEFISADTYIADDWFTIGLVPSGDTMSLTGTHLVGPISDFTNYRWFNFFFDDVADADTVNAYLFVYNSGTEVFDVTKYGYTGSTENAYEGIVVAALRPRGRYVSSTLVLEATLNSQFSITSDAIESNPLAEFTLTISGTTGGLKTFNCSMDKTSSHFITKVLGTDVFDKNYSDYPLYVFESYPNLLKALNDRGLVRGLSLEAVSHNVGDDFLTQWDTPMSPMIVSEVRGGKVDDLFQIISIPDGDSANAQIKVTIMNINLETAEFDLIVRDFNDTDDNMVVLEKFSRCSMNPDLPGYVALKIGTSDTKYALNSKYIMLVLNEEHPTDAVPAGFKGFTSDQLPTALMMSMPMSWVFSAPAGPDPDPDPSIEPIIGNVLFKTEYNDAGDIVTFSNGTPDDIPGDRIRKVCLGLSSQVGFDADLFKYKGTNPSSTTPGFHLSVNAADLTGNTITTKAFECTPYDFEGQTGGDANKLTTLANRKFTLAVCGGFDGWDVYRSVRTFGDGFIFKKATYNALNTDNGGVFSTSVGNSDYYAYLAGIETYQNPEAVDINVFATPGINFYDHSSLTTQAIDMIENDRADSLYIVATPNYTTVDEVTSALDTIGLDSNYSAVYWPWIQVRDQDNSTQLFIPPTGEVLRNTALTDNVSYPWFAVAGYSRGLVNAIKAQKKLTLDERDSLYKNRINPIATFSDTGPIIWGNKTLQVRESALDRINVRRLLLRTRKLISAVAVRLLFEQNDDEVRNEFTRLVNPILEAIKKERGLYDFRLVVSNDPEDIDANTLRGKIYIKPTRSLEFIDVEFIITPTGASFENV